MYVEYDSVRDFFFLVPPAFLGALADFLEGVLAILLVLFLMCWWLGGVMGAAGFEMSSSSSSQGNLDFFE
jgi:hypothetical protein